MPLKKLSYLPLLTTLFCLFSLCGDEFTDFSKALERVQPSILSIEEKQKESSPILEKKDEKKDIEAAPGLPAVRVIVQSDDEKLFDRNTLTGVLKKLNKNSGDKLFRTVNTEDYDQAKKHLTKDFQIEQRYKTILIAGWKPTISTSKYWTPSPVLFHKETFDETVRNYFGDFETTPKDKSAILIMLVLLSTQENSLEEKLQRDTFEYKLTQSFTDRSQEDLQGTITLASAIFKDNQLSDLTLYSVDPADGNSAKESNMTLQDWLKLPLVPAKAIPKKIEEKIEKKIEPTQTKKELVNPTKTKVVEKPATIPASSSTSSKKPSIGIFLQEPNPQDLWTKGFEKAKKFTYNLSEGKKPKLRLIVTSNPPGHNDAALKIVTDYLTKQGNLFEGPIEIVNYDQKAQLLNLRDGNYKNIFVTGRGASDKAYLFFRSDGDFSAYQKATDFSPNSTLLLIVPLAEEETDKLSILIHLGLETHYYTNKAEGDSSGDKYVVIGQSTPVYGDSTPFIVFKRDGSLSTVANWLTWGVGEAKAESEKKTKKSTKPKKESVKPTKITVVEEPVKKPASSSTSSKKLSPEEQKKVDWEKGLEKALSLTYNQKPKVRLIITSTPNTKNNSEEAKNQVIKYLDQHKDLFDGIESVTYDSDSPLLTLSNLENTDQNIYKNIFVYGRKTDDASYIFFRPDGAFTKYTRTTDFSPNTTLLLVVPLDEKVKTDFEIIFRGFFDSLYSIKFKFNSIGSKYVTIGQSTPVYQDSTPFIVFKRDGSLSTVADWLTWGVGGAAAKKIKKPASSSTSSKKLSSEEQEKTDWEEGLKKALAFKYKKTPKLRIIISTEGENPIDQQNVKKEIEEYIKENKLSTTTVEWINYDEELAKGINKRKWPKLEALNFLDPNYKNIFIVGLNGKSGQSTFFLREVYLSVYATRPASQFSPVTTLLLVMPLNNDSKSSVLPIKCKKCYKYDLVQATTGKWTSRLNICGQKYVAIGQTKPFAPNTDIEVPVVTPNGSITSLAEWLTWGVPS